MRFHSAHIGASACIVTLASNARGHAEPKWRVYVPALTAICILLCVCSEVPSPLFDFEANVTMHDHSFVP